MDLLKILNHAKHRDHNYAEDIDKVREQLMAFVSKIIDFDRKSPQHSNQQAAEFKREILGTERWY